MTKSECRLFFKNQRELLTENEISLFSETIIHQLIDFVDFTNKNVSVFLPISSKKEINTYPLLELKNKFNATIGLPVSDFSSNQMKHLVFEKIDQIKISKFDIPEPMYGDEIQNSEFDIVIVPLLGFDKKGNRVGYGKGFYDRFLSQCKIDCIFIGLSFFEPIELIEDTEINDIQLHVIITPSKIYNF